MSTLNSISTNYYRLKTISCSSGATKLATGAKNNYYKVLSLESERVGFDEIKKAYRSLALRHHPDACPASRKEVSTKMFLELHRAYETLSDPVLRRRYDNEMMRMDGIGRVAVRSDFSRDVWEEQLRSFVRLHQYIQQASQGH
ncbi:uncharacterized protein [Typha angustifolia]|uniref:uncharacterized protein n=1 Tax=Typha angustifolia TaxID=59011 RepID=UPI003C3047BE